MAGRGRALVLFSRLPIGRETKTRLAPLFTEEEREALHRAMWADVFAAALGLEDTDILLYWTGSGGAGDYQNLIPPSFSLRRQRGGDLGGRMCAALRDSFEAGYGQALLMGTDVPDVRTEYLEGAFDALKAADVVLGPSMDGGYWLVGMRRFIPEVFDIESWGGGDVLHATLRRVQSRGLRCALCSTLLDLDTPEDARLFLERREKDDSAARRCLLQILKGSGLR